MAMKHRDLFAELHAVKRVSVPVTETPAGVVLRPYQRAAVENVFERWQSGDKSVLIQLPTGCGKTVVFSEIMRLCADKGRILLLAHRRELLEQAKRQAIKVGLTAGIEMGDDRVFNEQVVCSSVQTQTSKQHCRACSKHGCNECDHRGWFYRFQKFNPHEFGLIVVDEAHHATADTYRRTLAHYSQNPECNGLGVTATPKRGDDIGLWNVFHSCAYQMDIADAVGNGWLVPLKQQFVTVTGLDLTRVGTKAGDLKEGQLERAFLGGGDEEEEQRLLHSVAAPLAEISAGKPTLLFCSGVDHAVKMTGALNSYPGVRAEVVLGKTDPVQREQILKRYSRGETNTLVNVGVATEGFDAPATAVVGIARPTKSLALYMQMIGRGTRPLPGVVDGPETPLERLSAIASSNKPHCTIVDFCGNAGKHKLISVVDVLAGEQAEDLRQEMVTLAKKSGEALTLEELQERVRQARERREQAAAEERKLLHNGYKAERVEYSADAVDMFGGDVHLRQTAVWEQRCGDLSEKQFKLLCKLGIKPETAANYSVRQAGAVITAKMKGTGGNYVLKFGKYAGKKISDVPTGYVQWLANKANGKSTEHAREYLNGGQQHARESEPLPF